MKRIAINGMGRIGRAALKVILDTDAYTAIQITNINGNTKLFITANTASKTEHSLKINNNNYQLYICK